MTRNSLSPATRFLKPGELAVLNTPTIVTTILGSCVAVVLFDPQSYLGAICHAVFPKSTGEQDLKYVDQALSRMLASFDRRAINRNQIVTKLFGGAKMFSKDQLGVGSKNVDAALKGIEKSGLALTASDIGGVLGRKLIFNSQTGEVFIKRLHSDEVCP